MHPARRRRLRARLRKRPRPKPETREYVALLAVSLHSSAGILFPHGYGMYEKSSGSGGEIGTSKNLAGSGCTMVLPREARKMANCSIPPRPMGPERPGSIHFCT